VWRRSLELPKEHSTRPRPSRRQPVGHAGPVAGRVQGGSGRHHRPDPGRNAEGGDLEYGSIDRNDPQSIEDANDIEITIKGVQSTRAGDFRRIVNDVFGAIWNLAPVNSTDYRMTMKTTEALKLRRDTVIQSRNTIEKKINGLGLTESTVQERGNAEEYAQLLVQMPGVDDPARVKEILRTAALLELFEVKDGPFNSREDALAKHGGIMPLNTQLIRGCLAAARSRVGTW
jgi:preprotein translocase subunit SecD